MDLNSVIVYFPWGGGGNLVKNIISLDPRFEFYDDQEFRGVYPTVADRYQWMLAYYSRPVQPSTWLQREWSIRASSHRQYYSNGVATYWNPDQLTVYDIHGTEEEIQGLMLNPQMLCYDRYKITHEGRPEQFSPWHIQDCQHIFLLPDSIQLITQIYNSKNPTLNQLESEGDLLCRRARAEIINTTMTQRLVAFNEHLKLNSKPVIEYCADKLYGDTGHNILLDIVKRLELDVPTEYVTNLHNIWLRSTRDVYRSYFDKELEL
jgi:hypothetical protein